MATTATTGNLISMPTHVSAQPSVNQDPARRDKLRVVSNLSAISRVAAPSRRRRRITPEAGRAIEILGHAIEYLADDFALECMTRAQIEVPGSHPRIDAIHMLMVRNREIYLSCPEVPTLSDRLHAFLHPQLG